MGDTVLDIHNVRQVSSVDGVVVKRNKNFGAQLRDLIVEETQEELPDGNIKLTLILDPKIREVKNG